MVRSVVNTTLAFIHIFTQFPNPHYVVTIHNPSPLAPPDPLLPLQLGLGTYQDGPMTLLNLSQCNGASKLKNKADQDIYKLRLPDHEQRERQKTNNINRGYWILRIIIFCGDGWWLFWGKVKKREI